MSAIIARRSGRRIHITRHAVERLEQRAPSIGPARAMREVADALDQGRVAANQPAWAPSLNFGQRRRARRRARGCGGTRRYTWNPDETRAYLVDLSTTGRALIITILTRQEQRAA